jgi:hypothetical protein
LTCKCLLFLSLAVWYRAKHGYGFVRRVAILNPVVISTVLIFCSKDCRVSIKVDVSYRVERL